MRVTGQVECSPHMLYRTEQIDLQEYVKGVLPNEWLPKWDNEALKAGAVAVKQYALSMHNTKGYVWDCTWDQVYDPTKRTDQTDQAVEDTWDWYLLDRGGSLVTTLYNANRWGCYGRGDNCMSQEGSQMYASKGGIWYDILGNYYQATLTILGDIRFSTKPMLY